MNLISILGIALALAMDAFAVALGLSATRMGLTLQQSLRLAVCFGLFQFGMPLVGWAAGQTVLSFIETADHWVAAGLLFLVAGRMVYESLRTDIPKASSPADPTRGLSLLVLSVATSIDALAVGLSLALLQVPILYPALVIGLVALVLTLLGTRIGPVLGRLAGKHAGLVGAAVLIIIAVKILVEHL